MWRWRKDLNSRSGFLLLEVLVSVTVISLGLIYIVHSFSSSTRAIETSSNYLKSLSFLEERLWDLEERGTIEQGKDQGRFKDERYTWSLEAEGIKDIPINIVKLKVEWEGPRKRQRVSLETCLWNEEE